MVNVASQELKHAFDRLIRLIFKLFGGQKFMALHQYNIFWAKSCSPIYTGQKFGKIQCFLNQSLMLTEPAFI